MYLENLSYVIMATGCIFVAIATKSMLMGFGIFFMFLALKIVIQISLTKIIHSYLKEIKKT
jgi:hypothetical protein